MTEPTKQDINELTKALDTLNRTMSTFSAGRGLTQSGGGSSVPGAGGLSAINRKVESDLREQSRSIRRSTRTFNSYDAALRSLLSDQRKAGKNLQDLTETYEASAESLELLTSKVNLLARSRVNSVDRAMAYFSDNFTNTGSALVNTTRATSLLTSSLIKQVEDLDGVGLAAALRDLRARTQQLLTSDVAKGIATQLGMLEADLKTLRDDLDVDDFAEFNTAIGELTSTLAMADDEAAKMIQKLMQSADVSDAGRRRIQALIAKEGAGLGTLHKLSTDKELLGVGEARSTAAVRAMDMANALKMVMQRRGIDVKGSDTGEIIANLKRLGDSAKEASSALQKTAASHTLAAGQAIQAYKNMGNSIKERLDELATFGGMMASLSKAIQHLKKVYEEAIAYNVAGVGRSFLNMQLSSIRLGMSFEEATKLMVDNANVFSRWGAGKTDKFLQTTEKTFAEFGYTLKQGSAMMASFNESAIGAGINMRDTDQLNGFLKKSLDNADTLRALTGITGEAVMRLNADLYNSEDVFKTMMGMDTERRAAYALDLQNLRKHYVSLGLSAEAANDLVKQQQAQLRAPVRERMKRAAFMQLGAMQAGLSQEDATRLMEIEMKGRRATPEELAFRAKMMGQIGAGLEGQSQLFGPMAELMQERIEAGMGTPTAEMQALRAQQAGMGMTDGQIAAAKEAARGSEALAKLGNVVNTVSSVMQNNLVLAAVASAGALFGLARSAGMMMGALGRVSGATTGAGAAGAAGAAAAGGGLLAKLKGAGGTMAKGGLVGAGIAGVGALGGSLLGGEKGEFLSDIAMGTGLGAMFGPWGAAIGALGGLGYGAYKYFGGKSAIGGSTQPGDLTAANALNTTAIASENFRSLADSTLTVSDQQANQTLQQIAALMAQSVQLLQSLSDRSTLGSPGLKTATAGASQYMNGGRS